MLVLFNQKVKRFELGHKKDITKIRDYVLSSRCFVDDKIKRN